MPLPLCGFAKVCRRRRKLPQKDWSLPDLGCPKEGEFPLPSMTVFATAMLPYGT